MNFAKHLLVLGLAASVTGLVSASCSIPKPECTVGQTSTPQIGLNFAGLSAFAVRYHLKSGNGECANFKGEVVGFQSYHPDTGNKERDFTKTNLAVRTQSLGELAWMTEDLGVAGDVVQPNALSAFKDVNPDTNDMCTATTFSPAQVIFPGAVVDSDPANFPLLDDKLPATCMADTDCNANFNYVCAGADPMANPPVPGACALPASCTVDADCNGTPGGACRFAMAGDPTGTCTATITLPATDLKYEWTNVNFYVTAAATGTQFSADVKITLNGCVADYTAIGMWPAIPCSEFPYVDPETPAVTDCDSDAQCTDTAYPTCQLYSNLPDPVMGACIKACTSDGDCSGITPKCDTAAGACVGCLADSDCKKKDFNTCVSSSCAHIVAGGELCKSDPDAALGRPVGSGINPDFGPIECGTDVAVVPVVDAWYSVPENGGAPLSEPRCVLTAEKIPALNPSK